MASLHSCNFHCVVIILLVLYLPVGTESFPRADGHKKVVRRTATRIRQVRQDNDGAETDNKTQSEEIASLSNEGNSTNSSHPLPPPIAPSSSNHSGENYNSHKGRTHLITSDTVLSDHLLWGSSEQRNWRMNSEENARTSRVYIGYGPCNPRWAVNYRRHILQATNLDVIILAYIEMFRMHCKANVHEKYESLFNKGYARLQMDKSVAFSNDTILFTKEDLSFGETDDLEDLIEFTAFTEVYVSWFKYPVKPIDPMGNEIKDACFIEIVARLHAVDLIMSVAKRHTTLIAFLMAVKLKTVIKMVHVEFKAIKGHDRKTNHRRAVTKRCLVVTMALAQFLFRKSQTSIKGGCAHEAFQDFYFKKEAVYMKTVEKFGRKPEGEKRFHAKKSEEFDSKIEKLYQKRNKETEDNEYQEEFNENEEQEFNPENEEHQETAENQKGNEHPESSEHNENVEHQENPENQENTENHEKVE